MSGSGPGVGHPPQSRYTKPLAEQLESRQDNTTDAQFKKTHQVVGQPETTDHDMHEDFIKNPPKNLPGDPAGDAPTAGDNSNAPNTVEAKSVDEIKSRIGDA